MVALCQIGSSLVFIHVQLGLVPVLVGAVLWGLGLWHFVTSTGSAVVASTTGSALSFPLQAQFDVLGGLLTGSGFALVEE
jgi:hypothetical protein